MLGWLRKLHQWVVGGEAWAAAYSWLSERLPDIWQWLKDHWLTLTVMLTQFGIGTWFASGINAISDLGWGAWPFVGLLFAFGLTALFYFGALTVERVRRAFEREKRSLDDTPRAVQETTTVPVAAKEIVAQSLPTAADLLDEQERREESLSIHTFVTETGNRARADLEATISRIAELASYDGSKSLSEKRLSGNSVL